MQGYTIIGFTSEGVPYIGILNEEMGAYLVGYRPDGTTIGCDDPVIYQEYLDKTRDETIQWNRDHGVVLG